ncbi:MAG TPA: hypothetical protein VF245_05665 [Solirubrobacterales bacterium]
MALPRVEDPWPSSIGMDLPFTIAGAGGVFGAAVSFHAASERRERAVLLFGFLGFWLGTLFYVVALANQLVFGS